MEPVVCLADVSCRIGKSDILQNVSLQVERGQIIGILGPNGAGKTTLLSAVTGLLRHTTGEITVLGHKLPAYASALRRRIGVVLQETALYEELTTRENLQFAASLYNVADTQRRIDDVLQLLMLSDRASQRVSTLSGGLRRRVSIARALLHNPDLLIIDEPTLGVDVEARHAIWSHLRMLRAAGTTIMVSTNYLDEAQALCTRVAVLCQGKLLTCEEPDDLVARTGTCLDVECGSDAAGSLAEILRDVAGIMRIEQNTTGLTIFLNSETASAAAIELITRKRIEGFHKRAPDLAEVFKALGAQP